MRELAAVVTKRDHLAAPFTRARNEAPGIDFVNDRTPGFVGSIVVLLASIAIGGCFHLRRGFKDDVHRLDKQAEMVAQGVGGFWLNGDVVVAKGGPTGTKSYLTLCPETEREARRRHFSNSVAASTILSAVSPWC